MMTLRVRALAALAAAASLLATAAPAQASAHTPSVHRSHARVVAKHRAPGRPAAATPVRCVKAFTHVYKGKRLVTGKFCGKHLTDRQIAGVLYKAGFRGNLLTEMVATTLAESNGYDRTLRFNRDAFGRITSIDYDTFQINSKWHPAINKIRRGDTAAAARLAYSIARRYGLDTWGGYNHRSQYMKRAQRAVAGIR